jgi:hypothetical protein
MGFIAPSLSHFASVIANDVRCGKLLFIEIPRCSSLPATVMDIARTVQNDVAVAGSYRSDDIITDIDVDEVDPQSILTRLLDPDSETKLVNALEWYGDEDLAVCVAIRCQDVLPEAWEHCFKDVARALADTEPGENSRTFIIFISGAPTPRSLSSHASVSRYALWNAIEWEDLRLMARWLLAPGDTNPLFRAWQIATYSAAANGDPTLLGQICDAVPKAISETLSLINSVHPPENDSKCGQKSVRFVREDRRWRVPTNNEEKWMNGCITGMSVERGSVRPWLVLNTTERESYLRGLIWREQVAGLFSSLVEMSQHTADWVTKDKSDKWKRLAPIRDVGEWHDSLIEPKDLLDIFSNNRSELGRLPTNLFELLCLLRRLRNSLAHLEPVDSIAINKLWGLYINAQDNYD